MQKRTDPFQNYTEEVSLPLAPHALYMCIRDVSHQSCLPVSFNIEFLQGLPLQSPIACFECTMLGRQQWSRIVLKDFIGGFLGVYNACGSGRVLPQL